MPVTVRFGWLAAALLLVGWFIAAPAALAQSQAQIQQIMTMSPGERERLMRQLGVSERDVMRMLGEQGMRPGEQTLERSRPRTDMDEPDRERSPQLYDSHDPFVGGELPRWQPHLDDESDLSSRVDYSRRHGLELFARGLRGYQELYSVPVPDDYVIGPGDVFRITLFGTETGQHHLMVQRDGWIDFPALGPISVAGLSFADARQIIADRISREKLGVRSSITLEQLKSMQLAVSGEVRRPGVYVVPSLVSVIQLLNLAGGATDVGALRRIRLLRPGEREDIDLYDFILTGERSDVIRLKPGDRLHVPAVEAAVQVKGAVRRPGVYEILPGETLETLLGMAGGPAPDAALVDAVLRRYESSGRQEIVDVDLRAAESRQEALQDGMILRVPRASEFTERQLELKGEVTVPGVRQWRPGLRLSDLFRDLRTDVRVGRADLDHGYVVRTDPDTRQVSFLSFSLREMFREPGSRADLLLQQEDVVLVLPMPGIVEQERERDERRRERELELAEAGEERSAAQTSSRGAAERRRSAEERNTMGAAQQRGQTGASWYAPQALLPGPSRSGGEGMQPMTVDQARRLGYLSGSIPGYQPFPDDARARERERERESRSRFELLEPYLDRLHRQTRDGSGVPVFTVAGEVHAPGSYPITQEQHLRDALQAAGGLLESADLRNAVVLRRAPETSELSVFSVDLERVRGDQATLQLMPGDVLTIRRDPALGNRVEVEITGEVASPGSYTLPAGATLSDLLELAGGVTQRADLRAAIFSRARLREMEQELRTRYVAEIRKSLIDAGVAGDQRAQASPAVLNLLDQLEEAISDESDGRLQIDLPRLAAGDMSADVGLSDGDRLRIPSMTNAISVAGQVRAPGSFAYVPGMSVASYLELAGGFAPYSDEKEIFILRADGSVQPVGQQSSWRRFGRQPEDLQPGDRIVVPIEYGYINRWDLAKEVVQFIYQTGIGLAAVVAALR